MRTSAAKSYLQARCKLPMDLVLHLRSLVSHLHAHTQRIFFHIVACYIHKPWDGGWVPVSSYFIRQNASQATVSDLVQGDLVEVMGHNSLEKRSREYRPAAAVCTRIQDLLSASILEGSNFYDLMSGKQTSAKARTLITEGNNQIRGPLGDGLRVYRAMKTPINADAVRAHLGRLQLQAEVCQQGFVTSGAPIYEAAYELVLSQNGGVHPFVHAGPRYSPEYCRLLAARERYLNDLRCYDWIRSQYVAAPPGIGGGCDWYQPAYDPQMSGRVTHIGGGLQSCSREMKEAAYSGVDDLHNYDLKSSQPRILLQRFREVPAEHRPKTIWIEDYLKDPSAKYVYARRAGVSVDLWKTALCAVMMGAALPPACSGSRGEVARLVAAEHAGEEEETYRKLRLQLADPHREIKRWHDYLIEYRVPEVAFNSRGGRMIKNESGQVLKLQDLDTRPFRRRGQVAAFYLQGLEAAFIHSLAVLGDQFGYLVVANEHDGLVTIGEIPDQAVQKASERSGLLEPILEEKPFVGQRRHQPRAAGSDDADPKPLVTPDATPSRPPRHGVHDGSTTNPRKVSLHSEA